MLVVCRTPLRISLFGGGTDYREYFEHSEGAVIGTTINKFIFQIALPMSGIAKTRFRFTYSQTETVDEIDEIKHPVIREVLREQDYDVPLNVAVISDMPGGTGLGSSSAFTVGMLNLVSSLKGVRMTKYDMALEAHQDRERGAQGARWRSGPGPCRVWRHVDVQVPWQRFPHPADPMNSECRARFNDSLVLVFTGTVRSASAVLEEQINKTKSGAISKDLSHLLALAKQGSAALEMHDPDAMMVELGKMLNDAWYTKRAMSSGISNPQLDEIHAQGIKLGAYGGKLLGAGGGGFMLFLTPSHTLDAFNQTFGSDRVVVVGMEDTGVDDPEFPRSHGALVL